MALLDDVIAAHGGPAREKFAQVEAMIVATGGLFPLRGLPTDVTPRRMTALPHAQRTSVAPFGAPDQITSFTADRIAVEKIDGAVVAENNDLPSLFAGLD